ncbi:MAG: methylenetetrahydrofolate reductase, partial [Hyphomicrobiales bacterium]|nr:methylenetetrahydrofolate reductase [Hyphomicrobiales bacterium]
MTIAIDPGSRSDDSTGRADRASALIARTVGDLIVTGSLELGAHRPDDARDIAELLPAGTPVFINHLPRHGLDDTLRGVLAVARAGLTAVPHIAARRVTGTRALDDFLARAAGDGGVRKVLVLGGDAPDAAGPHMDAESLLASGRFEAAGIREVAFAAYPEGHPRIATEALTSSLDRKLALAQSLGLGASVVTQFSFNPSRIVELAVDLQRRAPSVPVIVGVPGPTSPASLMRFAQ